MFRRRLIEENANIITRFLKYIQPVKGSNLVNDSSSDIFVVIFVNSKILFY